jgi:starch-binding outer membrane protein, SusD/RagB family
MKARPEYTIKNVALLSTLLLAACNSVIDDPKPKGVLAEGLSSSSIADGLVVAAYQGLSANVLDVRAAFVGPASNWVMDVRSDDAYTGGEGASVLEYAGVPQMERGHVFPSDVDGDGLSVPLNKWRNNVTAIRRANKAILNILDIADPTFPQDVRLAEMKLLRAHFHFDLKRNFKNIPYYLENDDPNLKTNSEFTEDQIWDFIKSDLQFAFDHLPVSQGTDKGRVNKYVAAAYLCKVHVERKDWADAIIMADFVMSGPFNLLGEFENLAKIAFENSSETIFAFQYSRGNVQQSGQYFPNHDWSDLLNVPRGPYVSGDGFYLGSQNLANAFRTDANGLPLFDTFNDVAVDGSYAGSLDPRIDFTMGRVGIPWKDLGVYDATWIRNPAFFPLGHSSKKHVESVNSPAINAPGTFPWAASGLNYQYIRFAEILLWKAEAIIESNGNLDQARAMINEVRSRAKASTVVKKLDNSGPAANYNVDTYPNFPDQDYARKALRFERRLELAMEGHRYYDLMRWEIVKPTMDLFFMIEVMRAPHLFGDDLAFPAGQEYLPFPQEEIDLAPNLYQQDSNY